MLLTAAPLAGTLASCSAGFATLMARPFNKNDTAREPVILTAWYPLEHPEGLFAAERKKKLPCLPQVIGIVTSPTGAVIRDILHRLSDRFPRRVLVWPVAVQGEGAAMQVAAAMARAACIRLRVCLTKISSNVGKAAAPGVDDSGAAASATRCRRQARSGRRIRAAGRRR